MPLCVGGGIRTVADVRLLLGNGADKVSINTAAVERLGVRKLTASCYGSHVGSAKAFLANGWVDEGRRPAQFVGRDGVEDQWMLGLVLRDAP